METFIILSLSGISIWLGWRLYRLREGITSLTEAIQSDPLPSIRKIDADIYQRRLKALSAVALNTVAEATLTRDSERRKREFLETLLNEIKDPIFILDSNREIRFLNESARQLFPSDQPYMARAFIDVCRDHRVFDTLVLADEVGAKVSDNIVLRKAEPGTGRMQEINLLVEAEPLVFHGSNSDPDRGSWVLLRDVTNELETEQIRQDFVANASHELRTPLSIINGYLESMDDPDTDLNQELYRRAVRTMKKHGERIARIIEDMLMISKLENADNLLNHEPFSLRDSAEEMVSQLMPIIDEKHARVSIKSDPVNGDWILVGDRFYWDQIFFNLIENALKQNPEPGLNIKIRFRENKGRYLISICDDGIGIPSADVPLVFKRFYRVEKHHATIKTAGTGLGLSIVKRAIEAHHGTVNLESEPGVKTEFVISVPATKVPTGSPHLD
ncbi:MAG: ATP-binding protein [Verrucomicrobiales bacterium]|nr:ATP-binding protein [Verrucomicrobiales bacterium]